MGKRHREITIKQRGQWLIRPTKEIRFFQKSYAQQKLAPVNGLSTSMYCTQFKQQLAFEELTFITKPSYFHSFSRISAPSLLTSFFSLLEIYIDGHIDKTPSNTRVQKDKYFNWKNRSKKGDGGGGGGEKRTPNDILQWRPENKLSNVLQLSSLPCFLPNHLSANDHSSPMVAFRNRYGADKLCPLLAIRLESSRQHTF